MGKSFEELMAGLPARRRRAIEGRAQQLIAQEMTLRELRKAMGQTQTQLARRLGKPQAAISRMEAQSDMLISTLQSVLQALGGRLTVRAELPGHAPVELTGLGDIGTQKPPPRPREKVVPQARQALQKKTAAQVQPPHRSRRKTLVPSAPHAAEILPRQP